MDDRTRIGESLKKERMPQWLLPVNRLDAACLSPFLFSQVGQVTVGFEIIFIYSYKAPSNPQKASRDIVHMDARLILT